MLEQIIIFGTLSGLVFALIALGFTLVYGISGIVNLTHGAFFMLSAYIYGILIRFLPNFISLEFPYLTPVIALILSTLFTGIIGSIFYRLALHPILGDEISILVVSICGCLIFQQLIFLIMGSLQAASFRIPSLIHGIVYIGSVRVLTRTILAAFVSILAFITLTILLEKTKAGNAMKALSQDLEAAMLMGISTERLYIFTTAISACLAGIAGIMFTSTVTESVSVAMWLDCLAYSFAIVIIGGLGSIKGTLLGGLIFGYAQAAANIIIPYAGYLQESFPFIIMILVLIIRPKGLFGKRVEME
jgi:branched-chain amino acid transport system permease protein